MQLSPVLADAPVDSPDGAITLPRENSHLVDGALVYLAAHPEQMEELDAAPAPEGFIHVMIQVGKLDAQHTAYIENLGGTVMDSWERFDTIAALVPIDALPELTYLPGLHWLEPSLIYYPLLDESVAAIRTDQVWTDYGIRGENTTIAIVDTGIDAQHESLDDLDDDPETDDPKVIGFYDARAGQRGEKEPLDAHGHGSHVSGIAAGTGGPSGTYRGVAPQAYLVGVLVGDGSGIAMADLLDGIDWVITNKDRFSIDVMSMSLGGVLVIPGATNDGSSAVSQAADAAVEAGIVTTIAVGNGNLQVAAHAGSVSAPADSRRAISIGSVNNNGARSISSSRGPTGDGRIKPDVMAPGVGIMSVDRNTGDGYTAMSGTSMACPHAAGLAVLMLQANPDLAPGPDVAYIKQIMHETSRHEWGESPDPAEPYSPNNQYGWGTVDSLGAVRRALDLGTGQVASHDNDGIIQALGSEQYSLNFSFAKSEYTYQGKNGDSHNPPLGTEAPDSIYLEARLPSSWPEPTGINAEPNAAAGLTATTEPDPLAAQQIDEEWFIGAWFNYSGDVPEDQLFISHPTLTITINAPDHADMAILKANFSLNDIPGDSLEELITVVSEPPDLTVALEADNSGPDAGDPVNFTLAVNNIGEGYSVSGVLRLLTSSQGRSKDELLNEWTLEPIAPGAKQIEYFEWNTTGQEGDHDFIAVLEDVVPEDDNPDNNDHQLSISVKKDDDTQPPPTNTLPSVEITSPDEGAVVQGQVTIEGTAQDPDEDDLVTVQMRIYPDAWFDVDGGESWSWEWDTTEDFNGEYTLQARADDGKEYSEISEITVQVDNEGENMKPTAHLEASILEVLVDETVDFDASGSEDDNEVTSYQFDFGDGETTDWQNSPLASHSYPAAGKYTVSVEVRDDQSVQSTNEAEVVIQVSEPQEGQNIAPTAIITNPREGAVITAEDPFFLVGRDSKDPDRDELSYDWVSDLQGPLGNESTLYATFVPGSHTLSLTVDDGNGGQHTTRVHITVVPKDLGEDDGDEDDNFIAGFGLIVGLIAISGALLIVEFINRRK